MLRAARSLGLAALSVPLALAGPSPAGALCGSAEAEEACAAAQPAEDEAEALAASAFLLQSALVHSRAPVRGGGSPAAGLAEASSEAATLQLGGARSAALRALAAPALERDSPLAGVIGEVLGSLDKPASDAFWPKAFAEIKRLTLEDPAAANFVNLCTEGRLEEYNMTGCAPSAGGSIRWNGLAVDAYFCGTPKVDWSNAAHPLNSICTAQPGSAYTPQGQCGRYGTKGLVVNFAQTVPRWREDVILVNVPSIDCILGLGNCDIYYCQNCPGRCG